MTWNCENDNDLIDMDNTYVDVSRIDALRIDVSRVDESSHNFKQRQPVYFTSNLSNALIRNACTGTQYPFKVGSHDSKQLFKVVDTLGIYGADGSKIMKEITRPQKNHPAAQVSIVPNHLYYDSPEEYTRHFNARLKLNMNVHPDLSRRWYETKLKNFPPTVAA
jgi:hypothetical protein